MLSFLNIWRSILSYRVRDGPLNLDRQVSKYRLFNISTYILLDPNISFSVIYNNFR
jgi:hypothetical protein